MLVKLGSSVKHVDYNNLKGQNYTTENRSTLSEEEKENVEKILFLLDKFCVGDAHLILKFRRLQMVFHGPTWSSNAVTLRISVKSKHFSTFSVLITYFIKIMTK